MVKKRKKFNAVTWFQKNLKFIILLLIAMLVLRNYFTRLVILLIFGMIGVKTLEITRVVPHISIETVSSTALMFGFLYGWQWGVTYGIIFGIMGYVKASQMQLTTIVNALFMGFCGGLGALFGGFGMSFFWAFMLSYLIRSNLGFVVFSSISPDPVGNIIHSYGDAAWSVVVVYQFLRLIFPIVQLLTAA